jgi:hypothetical protein
MFKTFEKYNTAAGRDIQNILFKNINYNSSGLTLSLIKGFDDSHRVQGVTFDGFFINEKEVVNYSANEHMFIGPFTDNSRLGKNNLVPCTNEPAKLPALNQQNWYNLKQ